MLTNKVLALCAALISFGAPAQAASRLDDPATIERVAHSQEWHRLLHYRRNVFGRLRSELDGPGFFFAPDGKHDPVAELEASAAAFSLNIRVGKPGRPAQCAFPARYLFVKKALGLATQDVSCPLLEKFLRLFHHPTSVTLVFSTAYPDNPGSMFGHTFLRIDSRGGLALLDQGVSYAASVGAGDNPLLFYWRGVMGGYHGAFSVVPYYAKVNEYNHAEARDLWEYELSLNEEQTHTLLLHLWELQTNSWFDYYFFDENCAYQLLTLLEVARPDWTLTRTPPWVIPGETVKILTRTPGAVRAVKFRPSYRQQLLKRYEALAPEQRQAYLKLVSGESSPAEASDRAAIDAAIARLVYEKQRDDGLLAPGRKLLLAEMLARRSDLGVSETVESPAPAWNNRPDLGQDAARLGISTGAAGISNPLLLFQELSWRSAYHDLMANDTGYSRFSQIEFPSLALRYYPKNADLQVERVGLLSIVSLFPVGPMEWKPSWGFTLDYDSPKDYGCLTCHTLRARGGAGLASQVLSNDVVIYGLAVGNFEVGESLGKGYRLGPGIQLGAIMNPLPPYKLRLGYQLISDLWQQERSPFFYQLDLEQSLSLGPAWEVRALGSLYRGYGEALGALNYYF